MGKTMVEGKHYNVLETKENTRRNKNYKSST
jgi:hypothetical protein